MKLGVGGVADAGVMVAGDAGVVHGAVVAAAVGNVGGHVDVESAGDVGVISQAHEREHELDHHNGAADDGGDDEDGIEQHVTSRKLVAAGLARSRPGGDRLLGAYSPRLPRSCRGNGGGCGAWVWTFSLPAELP